MRVLSVEDDDVLALLVVMGLKPLGFAVDRVATAEDCLAALATVVYDVVILDLTLPDADGITLLKQMRKRHDATPVLILSARSKTEQRVAGLDAGADDYLSKPFELSELAARLRALARRPAQVLGAELVYGNLVLIPAEHAANVDGVPLVLPRREAMVLENLMRSAGRPVSKTVLEDRLYAFGEEVASNSVEVHVHHLRKRLAAAKADVRIETRRGTGYVLALTEAG
jgi:DNA-binding response OmpR family regulator